jgi:hypothetical protein
MDSGERSQSSDTGKNASEQWIGMTPQPRRASSSRVGRSPLSGTEPLAPGERQPDGRRKRRRDGVRLERLDHQGREAARRRHPHLG